MIRIKEENKPLSTKVVRNVAFGGLRALLLAPVPFVMTPLILSKIGTRGYGTWAVLVTMNSLTSLADLGLLGTLSKYVAEYNSCRDFVGLNRLLNTGLIVFLGLASLIVLILRMFSSPLVHVLFRGSTSSSMELNYLFHCALILIWINVMIFFSSSVTSGLQRLDLSNLLTAFNVLATSITGAALLVLGWGVRGLLYANVISSALTLLAYSWLLTRLLPEFVLSPLYVNNAEAKKIFGFSLQMYVTQAAAAIHNQLEKLLLALLVGVVPVGWYDIAGDVALKMRSVPQLLLGPVLPAASELDAKGERTKLVDLYYRTHKYLAFVGVPLTFFAVAVSRRFVDLWIGRDLEVIAMPLAVLLVVGFFNLTTGPGYFIFAGQGILRPGMYSALLGLGLNIPLSAILIYVFGFSGAVFGTSISLISASVFFLYLFHHQTKLSFARLLRDAYLKPVVYSATLVLLLFAITPASAPSWLGLGLEASAFGVLYLGLLLFTKFFDVYDWDKMEGLLPIVRLARRAVPVA
jgi:O-antigen/teichoic acid export membrane protein